MKNKGQVKHEGPGVTSCYHEFDALLSEQNVLLNTGFYLAH